MSQKNKTNLTNGVFGRLTVLSEAPLLNKKVRRWACECSCGAAVVVSHGALTSGHTKSCGCLRTDMVVERNTTHGECGSPTWRIWIGMISRCYQESHTSFNRYGAVGVRVCDRWRESYKNFKEDMGERPDGKSIERVGGAKIYSPDNCVWATPKEQALSRATTRWYTYNGETLCLKDWARKVGMPYLKFYKRVVCRGWDFERAISENSKQHKL